MNVPLQRAAGRGFVSQLSERSSNRTSGLLRLERFLVPHKLVVLGPVSTRSVQGTSKSMPWQLHVLNIVYAASVQPSTQLRSVS